jgi:hypothetical protein
MLHAEELLLLLSVHSNIDFPVHIRLYFCMVKCLQPNGKQWWFYLDGIVQGSILFCTDHIYLHCGLVCRWPHSISSIPNQYESGDLTSFCCFLLEYVRTVCHLYHNLNAFD